MALGAGRLQVMQSVLGRSAFETGLLMTPWPLALGVIAPVAGRLADRVRAGLIGGIGLAIFAFGLFMLSRLGTNPGTLDIGWRMAVCGIGFGLFQSPNNRTIVNSAPRQRSGAAGGMLATARLLGQTSGDRKSTRLNSSHRSQSRMPSSA